MKIPRMLATILGFLMMLLGLCAVVVPDRVLPFARFTTTANGVYVAAAIRLAIGLILLMAAAGSRFPIVLRVLGGFALLGGIATLVIGVAGAQRIAEQMLPYATTAIRGIGAFLMILGAFVVYAVSGSRSPRSG
jgi:uncharacterized protein YjeT (DUF2065 family)